MTTSKPTKPARIFVNVPCIFRTEDGEETRLTARLPLDVVLRQIE